MSEVMRLHSADIEAIAQRTAELVGEHPTVGYVDAATLARMLSMSVDFVRDHAAELGAVRIGAGPKGELRFDLERVRAWLDERRLTAPAPQPGSRRRGRPPRPRGDFELLPLAEWDA